MPVASARMTCDMRCRLAAAHLAVERGKLAEAAVAVAAEIEDLLHRAIECGAMVDPWNILGFGGQYSLFPAVENSVHDHRVDELIDMVGDIFTLYVRIHKAAAAAGDSRSATDALASDSPRWPTGGTSSPAIEVGSVEGISGQDTLESAEHVAAALRAWHEGGAAAGDLAFWRQHVEQFRSPKAYALVIETLLDHRDPVAAMALLVQWLSQAEEIPLVEETTRSTNWPWCGWRISGRRESAARTAARGRRRTVRDHAREAEATSLPRRRQRWPLARKFLDYLEANAERVLAGAAVRDGRRGHRRRRKTHRDAGRGRRGRRSSARPTRT